jgi:hypothetical protein
VIEREGRQRRNGRLLKFRDFINRRSLQEEVAVNTNGASLITLGGSQSTEQGQSIMDEFSEDLND